MSAPMLAAIAALMLAAPSAPGSSGPPAPGVQETVSPPRPGTLRAERIPAPRPSERALSGAVVPAPARVGAPTRGRRARTGDALPPDPATGRPARAVADAPAERPLTLDEVLRASARTSPQILAAVARERQADGKLLTSRGEFDLLFKGDGFSRALGYYDGSQGDVRAYQPLSFNGGQVYGGYRASRGSFPIYEDQYYTNKLGEVKLGGVFALMRDRLTDPRRTGVALAQNDVRIAALDREMVAIGVQQRAIDAYLQWVSAGQRVAVYRDLLDLALARQGGIERQVRLGDKSAILATENRQNIVQRRTLLLQAERALDVAANDLSFFFRDADARPIVPGAARLPADLPAIANPLPRVGGIERIDRPDLSAILERVDKAEAERRLARNDQRPRLDLGGEMSKDLGPVGRGGYSRTPFETKLGVTFSLPLQRRGARGREDSASARIGELAAERARLEDQIVVEVNRLSLRARAAGAQIDLATQDIDLAATLARAEARKLFLGASDLLAVNQREQALTQARINLLDARYQLAALHGELAAATADREQLRLD